MKYLPDGEWAALGPLGVGGIEILLEPLVGRDARIDGASRLPSPPGFAAPPPDRCEGTGRAQAGVAARAEWIKSLQDAWRTMPSATGGVPKTTITPPFVTLSPDAPASCSTK